MPVEIISRLGTVSFNIEQTFQYTAYEDLIAKCVVCIDETTGNVRKAKADSWTTMPAIGITKDAVSAGQLVDVYQFGQVTGVSRDGDFQKDDQIFVSPLVAGNVTRTPPEAVGYLVQSLGRAINASDITLEIDQTVLELEQI
jgi:hypothetical protein